MSALRPALFLDRDGVINADKGYVCHRHDFDWMAGAADCISHFNRLGWYVFIVTNQSGIARGLYTEADMQALHDWMCAELAHKQARIDQIYYCPYHAEGDIERYRRDSFDRKPKPGMILQAMADYPVQRETSLLIGDKLTDMQAGEAAGVKTYLFEGGNLAQFAKWALADLQAGGR